MTFRALRLCAVTALAASALLAQDHWVATWAAAQQPLDSSQSMNIRNQTVRMIVRTSAASGSSLRLHISNAYGTAPLLIGAVHIALRSKDSEIVAASDRIVNFNGNGSARIPAGAALLSDTVNLPVPPLTDLAVSVFLPEDSGSLTVHGVGLHPVYISKAGNATAAPSIADGIVTRSWLWLSEIDVLAPADAATLVTFGDSITDGVKSTPDTDRSWPAVLAQRLAANKATANIGIANEGISGNRILTDVTGTNALARFDRDVLSIPGVRWVTILEGINDIGRGPVSAEDLIAGIRQMIERAHAHGIKVIGCTLTPFEGAGYYSEKGEETRQTVNQWVRTSKAFDATFDFDALTRDPAAPRKFRTEFDSGDHLHPGDAGYKAMADAIDLAVFGKN